MVNSDIRLPVDEMFNVVTRKTFIQVDSSPIRKPHAEETRGRGRSLTDTVVGKWSDWEHEENPSTGTPSDTAVQETDDEDIGEGVMTGIVYGESPEHSPCNAMYSRSLQLPMSPLHAPASPLFTHGVPGSPSPLHMPGSPFHGGAMLGPFAMESARHGAQTPPGVWNAQPTTESGRWSSPQPSRLPAQLPQSNRAMHQASRPLLAPGTAWSPSAPPGQFAGPPSPGPSRVTTRLPMEQLMMAATLAASRSPPGSVASSRNASPSRMTPRSPSNVTSFPSMQSSEITESKTTVVIRNLPHTYTREMVCEFMDDEGFKGRYDFVYLPTDFRSWLAFGYAFVNMVTPEDANDIMRCLEGFDAWKHDGEGKTCNVVWSDPYQGLEANIERYRNSPVMNESVSEQYKPMLFSSGRLVPFPAPTKKLRQPRIRRSSNSSETKAAEPDEF